MTRHHIPIGGSTPDLIEMTFTAADVVERWDSESGSAALEVPIPAGNLVVAAYETANTLDQNFGPDAGYAYTASASTADVLAGGEGVSAAPVTTTPGAYYTSIPLTFTVAAQFAEGASYYFTIVGDGAPTEGEYAATIVVFTA